MIYYDIENHLLKDFHFTGFFAIVTRGSGWVVAIKWSKTKQFVCVSNERFGVRTIISM